MHLSKCGEVSFNQSLKKVVPHGVSLSLGTTIAPSVFLMLFGFISSLLYFGLQLGTTSLGVCGQWSQCCVWGIIIIVLI